MFKCESFNYRNIRSEYRNGILLFLVLRNYVKLKFYKCDILLFFSKDIYFFVVFLNLYLKDFLIFFFVILFFIGCSFEMLSFIFD